MCEAIGPNFSSRKGQLHNPFYTLLLVGFKS
jgi:hypothetical protein